jgi:fructose-1,6-bisphosphatase/inositol monophosphatase family enzyme
MDRVGEILRSAAQTAVVPRFARLAASDVFMKATDDPVTIADREAETLIGEQLLRLTPDARIVGEEACSVNPRLLDNLGRGTAWIIDPIDGTANFAAGRAPFAMMVALLVEGELTGSWILDPIGDRLARAELGGGAWVDDQRLRADPALIAAPSLTGILSRAFVPAGGQDVLERVCAGIGRTVPTARCAGHEYPLVAKGKRHFALFWRTLVWDHAPGALLVSEAGGKVVYLDGSTYDPCISRAGLLSAHNPAIADAVLGLCRAPHGRAPRDQPMLD